MGVFNDEKESAQSIMIILHSFEWEMSEMTGVVQIHNKCTRHVTYLKSV